jgi:TonB-dependent starch-binding outer membrane protein SusC
MKKIQLHRTGLLFYPYKTILRMLKCVFILTFLFCLRVSANTYSQNVSMDIKNLDLKKALSILERKSDIRILYSEEVLPANKQITLKVSNTPYLNVLQNFLQNTNLTYKVLENGLIIIAPVGTDIKNTEIKGKVIDDKGEPLPGVIVKVKGSQIGTSTDVYGNYTLNLPDANVTLVFTYLGFAPQEVAINGKTVVNITLLPNSKALNEVVVIGYGTQRRGDVSGAIASVNMEKMREVPATNLTNALQGQVAGLVATPSSFRPGSGAAIRIRGNRSLSADNNPLYVVDGIPITYTIDDINPLDIESIDVLKDASATAVYGSRGANGVIQITTKKGKTGKLSVDYSGSTSFDNIINKLKIYDGPEFAQFRRDAFIGSNVYNTGTGTPKLYYPDPLADYLLFSGDPSLWQSVLQGYNFTTYDPVNKIFVAQTRPTTPEEQAVMAKLGYPVLTSVAIYDPSKVPTYDWQSQALRTGVTQSHNLSLSGGSDKFRSSLSVGFFNQQGIEYGQDYTRYSFSTNNEFKPNEHLTLGTSISYNNAIQNVGPDEYSGASGQFPMSQPYDAAGNFILFPGNDANVVNPLNDRNAVLNEIRVNRLLANVFAQVNILKGLNYRIAFGADMNNSRQGTFNGALSSASSGNPASATYQTTFGFVWTLQNQLSYTTTIAKKHTIGATIVQELQKDRIENTKVGATNLAYESQKWYSLANNTLGTINSVALPTNLPPFAQRQLVGYLGRLNYSYDSKYVVTLGYRIDQSSVFSEDKGADVFPSASVAWKIDQESFMKNLSYIDELKLRVGIGSVGQQSGIPPYLTRGPLNSTPTPYNFGGTTAQGYAPQNLPLPDLSWEKTTTKNIALDYSFLKGRISGSIDVYQSVSNNIQKAALPSASGYSFYYVNLGEVQNKGLEIQLNTVNISQAKSGFKWASSFTFATNKEEITYLTASGTDDIGNQWFLGQPVRNYNDYQGHGIFQYSDTQPGGILNDYFWKFGTNKTDPNFQPGRIRVDDINGDGIITSADKVNLGSPNPKWTLGINNTVSYKWFDLSAFVYISYGSLLRDIRPGLVGRYESVKVNYWTPTNPSNDYQQPNTLSDIPLYWQAISFRDGSFAKVKSLLLTYRVPGAFLKRFNISNLSLSVNAVNPFLFSKYDRYDPETVPYTSTYPSSSTANPSPTSYSYRSIVFGLKVGL